MILARVAVTTINHDSRRELGLFELLCDRLDVLSVKIGAMCRPAQDYVTSLVAFGAHNGRKALLGDREEVMSDRGSLDSVNSDGDIAISACGWDGVREI